MEQIPNKDKIQIFSKREAISTLTFHCTRHPLLARLGFKPVTKNIAITPTTLGVRKLYASHINRIPDFESFNTLSAKRIDLIYSSEYVEDLFLAMGYLIVNNHEKKVPKWLIKVLRNMTQDELKAMSVPLDEALNTVAFLNSIISMTGVSLSSQEIVPPDQSN